MSLQEVGKARPGRRPETRSGRRNARGLYQERRLTARCTHALQPKGACQAWVLGATELCATADAVPPKDARNQETFYNLLQTQGKMGASRSSGKPGFPEREEWLPPIIVEWWKVRWDLQDGRVAAGGLDPEAVSLIFEISK